MSVPHGADSRGPGRGSAADAGVPEIDSATEAALAAGADGSLGRARAAALQARASQSPALARALAEQRDALALIAQAQAAAAPSSLHARVDAQVREQAQRRRHRAARLLARMPSHRGAGEPRSRRAGWAWAASGAGVAGAAAAAIAIALLTGGGESRASARMTAYLTLAARPAVAPAPREDMSHRTDLADAVDGVPFPYWEDRFGWRAIGARTDSVGGRTVKTLQYADRGGQRIAYSIVAGPAPAVGGLHPLTSHPAWRRGVPYTVGTASGRTVVTWVRAGHRCVVSGAHLPVTTLLALASWRDDGAVA